MRNAYKWMLGLFAIGIVALLPFLPWSGTQTSPGPEATSVAVAAGFPELWHEAHGAAYKLGGDWQLVLDCHKDAAYILDARGSNRIPGPGAQILAVSISPPFIVGTTNREETKKHFVLNANSLALDWYTTLAEAQAAATSSGTAIATLRSACDLWRRHGQP